MTRKQASSKADIEIWAEEDAVESETTKVGDHSLAIAEAARAADLSKETRKATAFDLDAALKRARPSIPDHGRSGAWPRGSAPALAEVEIEIPIDVAPPEPAPPEPRPSRGSARALFDLVLVAVVVAAAALLLSR